MRVKSISRKLIPLKIVLILGSLALPAVVCSEVVISEIFFQPQRPDGDRLEFVEIFNSDESDVDVGGWHFESGIRFTFPEGVVVPASGHLIVCGDASAFEKAPPPGDSVLAFGDFDGTLSNRGEELVLRDATDAVVDVVSYDDSPPWPQGTDGTGNSLNRICVSASSSDPANWATGVSSPLGFSGQEVCPLPAAPAPSVVISEIFYHPPAEIYGRPIGVDDTAEFVEIHNLLDEPVDLTGWNFTDGIEFSFPDGLKISSGGILVVAKDPVVVRAKFETATQENTIGPWIGQMSNSGERITLSNAEQTVIDSVHYQDSGDWPYPPDGEGRSLERLVLTGPSHDPATWASSVIDRDHYTRYEVTGPAGPRADLDLDTTKFEADFLIGLDGPGEALVDNVFIATIENPDENILLNGEYTNDVNFWTKSGNALSSSWDPSQGVNGTGALRLVASTACPLEGCDQSRIFHGLKQRMSAVLLEGAAGYIIRFDARAVSGSFDMSAGFVKGTRAHACVATPGAQNSVIVEGEEAPTLPPRVSSLGRFPRRPHSDDSVTITAKVWTEDPENAVVRLVFGAHERGDQIVFDQEILLHDDGMNGDRGVADGVYGGELPAFPHNTQVRFRILVEEGGELRWVSPRPMDADVFRGRDVWGYYVSDEQPSSALYGFDLLIDSADGSSFTSVANSLDCRSLSTASLIFDGELYPDIGMRWRGNTACFINKRNFKVRFNRGRYFEGMGRKRLKKMNFNGLWTDKAIIREELAWDFHRQLGAPFVDTEYLRLNVSGHYFGLFLYLEHPDNCFLMNNGLDTDGNLYKATQPPSVALREENGVRRQDDGEYPTGWEEETNRGGDYLDLQGFINGMHDDAEDGDGPSVEFFQENILPDVTIDFQLVNIFLQNIDSSKKNHFLYHDLVNDRWGLLNWDVDLAFGKFFWPKAVDINPQNLFEGRQVGTLNDCLRSEMNPEISHRMFLNPWSMTSLEENTATHNLVDLFFQVGGGFYQRAYLVRFWDLLMEKYRSEIYDLTIDDRIDFLRDEIEDDFELWGRFPTNSGQGDSCDFREDDVDVHVDLMKQEIGLAREYLIAMMEEYTDPEIREHPRMKITEIMYFPESGQESNQYIELINTTGREIDITGWTIDGIDYEFPGQSIIGADEVVIVSHSPALFEALYPQSDAHLFGPWAGALSMNGEILRLRDGAIGDNGQVSGDSYPATIDYLAFETNGDWPSVRPGRSIELVDVTWDRDNDLGRNWRHSPEVGGSPGDWEVLFVRGNANGDATVDLSDIVRILTFLFLGDPAHCKDAADIDDSGRVDISDVIHLLKFLFLGAVEVPPPYPEPGIDPTDDDDLDCRFLALPPNL